MTEELDGMPEPMVIIRYTYKQHPAADWLERSAVPPIGAGVPIPSGFGEVTRVTESIDKDGHTVFAVTVEEVE